MAAGDPVAESALFFQVVVRPGTDVRVPVPGLIAALAEQFGDAENLAGGRLCVTVPDAVPGDQTPAVIARLLESALARRAAGGRTPVRACVAVESAWYAGDGYCHVLARIPPTAALAGARDRHEREGEAAPLPRVPRDTAGLILPVALALPVPDPAGSPLRKPAQVPTTGHEPGRACRA